MNSLLDVYIQKRALFLKLAYRMLGSFSEAEDLVQELYFKIEAHNDETIVNPQGYIVKMITNAVIDLKRSSQFKRMEYIGPWLPEPVSSEKNLSGRIDDSSYATLILLERLNPIERAVFVLRETLELSFSEIGSMLNLTDENCRKIMERAREHVKESERYKAPEYKHQKMLFAFLNYLGKGSKDELITILKEDVILYSDGGGKIQAAGRPLLGRNSVAQFLANLKKLRPHARVELRFVAPDGLLMWVDGKLENFFHLQFDREGIKGIYIQRNPEKLSWFKGLRPRPILFLYAMVSFNSFFQRLLNLKIKVLQFFWRE